LLIMFRVNAAYLFKKLTHYKEYHSEIQWQRQVCWI
jgi:hypothetical protein